MKVVIVGAGGHGQVIADLMLRASGLAGDPIGFVDDAACPGNPVLGLPVLGRLTDLPRVRHDAIVIAVGDNRRRLDLLARFEDAGERIVSVIHPTATVASDAEIGPGSMICAGAIVNTGTVIGKAVIVNTAATLDHHNQIGDGVHVAPGVHIGGEVSVGPGTLLGIGAVVLPRTKIGKQAIVGAGAVVTRDVRDGVTVVGVPARLISNA